MALADRVMKGGRGCFGRLVSFIVGGHTYDSTVVSKSSSWCGVCLDVSHLTTRVTRPISDMYDLFKIFEVL